MPSKILTIAIAGCGIGGLTAAIALRRAPHKVTIYEKSSLSHEVGQGITIQPNGSRILRNLGLDFKKARMADYVGMNEIDAETLELRFESSLAGAVEAYGIQAMTAYRVNLHAALVDVACSQGGRGEPVEIITEAEIVSFDSERGAVVLISGKEATADLVVAADGVKSKAVAQISGPDHPDLDSGDTIVYRFTLSKEEILSDALTAPLLDAGSGWTSLYVSPAADKWLVRYWCRDDGLQNFALYCLRTYENAQQQESELRFRTDKQSLLREMQGFHPALRRLAEMTSDALPLWRCTTREPLRSLHKGRLVAIGDAAHPLKPHIGMGANSAIEDAGVLGAVFKGLPEDMQGVIEERLKLFDKLRVGRVAVYKYLSDVPYFRKAVEEQRENCEKWMSAEELPATQAQMNAWRKSFDAVADAERALKSLAAMNGHA